MSWIFLFVFLYILLSSYLGNVDLFELAKLLDLMGIFTKIDDFETNIGRGGSQKAHMVSLLDLRLSCY